MNKLEQIVSRCGRILLLHFLALLSRFRRRHLLFNFLEQAFVQNEIEIVALDGVYHWFVVSYMLGVQALDELS